MVAVVAIDSDIDAPTEGVRGSSASMESAVPVTSTSMRSRWGVGRFFTAAVLSVYGDWLSTVALVVVLFELTHSAAGPAAYMLVRVAPRVVGPWLGGRLADRLTPRTVIICTSLVQALFTASLVASHRASLIWAIYLAVAVAQFIGAMGRPSLGAMLPLLVPDRELARANATFGLLFSTSLFVAPAIGAALLLRVGPDALFAIDAATFLVSALLIATLPRRRDTVRSPLTAVGRGAGRRTLVGVLRQPEIRIVAAANFTSGLVVTVTQALLVVAAHDRFGGDAAVGYLYASVGVGGALGGLVALRWIPPRAWTRLAVFLAVTIEIVAIAGFSSSYTALVAVLLLAISAATSSSFDTWGLTEIQRRAPAGFMGRFNSIIFMSMYAGMLVGAIWAVATASVLRWDVAIEYACGAALVIVGAVWVSCGKAVTRPRR
jgi:MFS family permease